MSLPLDLLFATLRRLALAATIVTATLVASVGYTLPVNPYEVTVAGDASDKGRAAALKDGLRLVAVRATGRRAAATEPALAPMFASARDYVVSIAAAGPGRVRITFDPAAVEAFLSRAGQPLWDRDRPQTLVVFAPDVAADAVAAAERRDLSHGALERGLSILVPTGEPAEHLSQRLEDLARGDSAGLMELAHRYRADELLVCTRSGTQLSYAAFGVVTQPKLGAHAEETVNALADRLAAAAQKQPDQGLVSLPVIVRGIGDVRAFASARRAFESLAPVRSVTLTEAVGDEVHLVVAVRGGAEALKRALADNERITLDPLPGDDGLGFKLQP